MSDPSLEVLKICNNVIDFLEGAQDYWSSNGILGGYSKATSLLTHHIRENLADAQPAVQITAGSFSAVGKALGTFYFGIGDLFHRSARDMVDHGFTRGVETFGSTMVEGVVEGVKFLRHQGIKWSKGDLPENNFEMAHEISATLATAVLMFVGVKSIHTGGRGLINGLKNMEISTPALATSTGLVFPVTGSAEALTGIGPMVEGLIYMSGSKDASSDSAPPKGTRSVDFEQMAKDGVHDKDAITALTYFAKKGEPEAIAGLVQLVKGYSDKARRKLAGLANGGSDLATKGMLQVFRENPESPIFGDLYYLATNKANSRVIAAFRKLDLKAVLTKAKYQKNRIQILMIKSLAGDQGAVQALADLAKQGDVYAESAFHELISDARLVGDIPARIKAFEILINTPGIRRPTLYWAPMRVFYRLPVERGLPILNWLIRESVKEPKIAEALVKGVGDGKWVATPEASRATYAQADYSPIYPLAKQDTRYADLLRDAYHRMSKDALGTAKRAELKSISKDLGIPID